KNDRESARHQRKPSLLRRITEQRLRKERQQQRAAEQSKAQHEHKHVRDAEGAIAEEMQVDDRIFMSPFPDDHKDQRSCGDQLEGDDEIRFESIVALNFIENDLQRTQTERYESQADVVDFCFTELAAAEVWRILNQPRSKQDGNNPDRNIDEENPAPGEVIGD